MGKREIKRKTYENGREKNEGERHWREGKKVVGRMRKKEMKGMGKKYKRAL